MSKLSGDMSATNNPSWPPNINEYIITKRNNLTYFGKVIKLIDDECIDMKQIEQLVILQLVKGHTYKHISNDDKIIDYLPSNLNPQNYMLITKKDGWRYSSEDKIVSFMVKNGIYKTKLFEENIIDNKLLENELLYDDNCKKATINNKYYANASEKPEEIVPLHELIGSEDLDDFSFLSNGYQSKSKLFAKNEYKDLGL